MPATAEALLKKEKTSTSGISNFSGYVCGLYGFGWNNRFWSTGHTILYKREHLSFGIACL